MKSNCTVQCYTLNMTFINEWFGVGKVREIIIFTFNIIMKMKKKEILLEGYGVVFSRK